MGISGAAGDRADDRLGRLVAPLVKWRYSRAAVFARRASSSVLGRRAESREPNGSEPPGQRTGLPYDKAEARKIAEVVIWSEAATISAVSSLYFVGMSARHLVYASHVTPHTDGANGQLAGTLWTDCEPHNSGDLPVRALVAHTSPGFSPGPGGRHRSQRHSPPSSTTQGVSPVSPTSPHSTPMPGGRGPQAVRPRRTAWSPGLCPFVSPGPADTRRSRTTPGSGPCRETR